MRTVIFGATGRAGGVVAAQAVRRRHQVVASARSAAAREWPEGVTAAAVDILDAAAVAEVLVGADAAVVTVGVRAGKEPTALYSAGVDNVLAGMEKTGTRRLSVVSATPAGPRDALPGGQRALVRLLDRFFGETYADMRRMEQRLAASDLDWVCLRPPRLVGGRGREQYRIGTEPLGSSLPFAGLAAALLDVLDDAQYRRRTLYVSG